MNRLGTKVLKYLQHVNFVFVPVQIAEKLLSFFLELVFGF